jgi:hypothetical protein
MPCLYIEAYMARQGVAESLSGDGRVMLASEPQPSKHLTITGPSSDKQLREVQRKTWYMVNDQMVNGIMGKVIFDPGIDSVTACRP